MPFTFCHSLGGQPAAVLYEIVQEYNRDHRPIVQLESVNSQNYAAAAKEALQKPPEERPNFILAPEFMTGAMQKAMREGIVVSVGSLLNQDRLDDIAELVKKTFGTHCLPFNPACGILYMNMDLLLKSGFEKDWRPKSFEDLIDAVKRIKDETEIFSGYTCAWPEAYLIEIFLAQRNLSLLDGEGNYNFVQLKSHILDLWQLVKDGIFLPPNTGNYDRTRDAFVQGKVAFYMQGSGHAGLIEKEAGEAGFEVGFAPLPTLSRNQKEKYAFPLGGAAIWVLRTSDDVEYVNERNFLNYLSSKEVQIKWHVGTAYVPVSKSVFKSLSEFYKDHPLHEAVVAQTIEAPLGENSFGIKKENYHLVRPKIYPLIRELLYLEGSLEDVEKIVEERLRDFQAECNQL